MTYLNTNSGLTSPYGQSAAPSPGASTVTSQQMSQVNAGTPMDGFLARLAGIAAPPQPGQPMQLQGAMPQQGAQGGILSQILASFGSGQNTLTPQAAGPASPGTAFSNGLNVVAPAQAPVAAQQQQQPARAPMLGGTRFVNGLNVVG